MGPLPNENDVLIRATMLGVKSWWTNLGLIDPDSSLGLLIVSDSGEANVASLMTPTAEAMASE